MTAEVASHRMARVHGFRLALRMAGTTVLVGCLALLSIQLALALTFPTLTGRVVDDAGILDSATRQTLDQKLADLEAKTTDQLVVVTLKSLQGAEIADYGYQLGRHWQIGQQDKNNGALLIVAPNERKVRIEVGYGLEGKMTDALAKVIIEGSILPRFRAGDFPGGIVRGVDDIVQVLTGDATELHQRAAQPQDTMPDWLAILIVLAALGAMGLAISLIFTSFFRQASGARRRQGGFWPTILAGGGSSGSSWSSGSSGGFSGGGGSFGGGGSSGSW